MKLSVCLIVKNEERFLADCLSSVKDVADQIVVLDTGSEDRTREIARKFNAEVHTTAWQDDFSAARNESIQYAKGDWILWLDADERLVLHENSDIKKLLTKEDKPIAYNVQIHNILPDGDNYKISHAHRLFRNGQSIRFSGRIHEQIAPSVSRLGGEERQCNLVIRHLGYALEGDDRERKNKRNRKLLEKMVREAPQNAYAHYTLAQHYGVTGEPKKAARHYERALGLNQFSNRMTASLLNVMAENYLTLGETEKARKRCLQSIRMVPHQSGGYYLLYRIEAQKGNWPEAEKRLLELKRHNAAIRGKEQRIATDIHLSDDFIERLFIPVFFYQNKYEEVCQSFAGLAEEIRSDNGLLALYSESCLKLGRWEQAARALQKLYSGDPQTKYLKALAVAYIKQQKFREAINTYERISALEPEDGDAIRRLAGLYGKIGQMEKSFYLLQKMKST
ncbi:MAG TPA: glycosyltransferase [Caldithrix abyssi]|uniref:Glycosyltransferase n=1 Tax=Caldithrix abyssi TaxID=187145 RepID=A0A7V4UCH0_CALAY|nr:glycosyltransferase [Caldithrix abyssi]